MYRNWCFTSFKGEPENKNEVAFELSDKMHFIIYQREQCPDTKKEHWQGYVEFVDAISLIQCKKRLNDRKAHVEPRKGTQEQAIEYCKKTESAKSDDYFSFGVPKQQGSRNDLDSICEAVMYGATKLELLREFKGNAFRHLGMIDRAQRAVFAKDEMDNFIQQRKDMIEPNLEYHKRAMKAFLEPWASEPKSTEVTGNTKRSLSKKIDPTDSDFSGDENEDS